MTTEAADPVDAAAIAPAADAGFLQRWGTEIEYILIPGAALVAALVLFGAYTTDLQEFFGDVAVDFSLSNPYVIVGLLLGALLGGMGRGGGFGGGGFGGGGFGGGGGGFGGGGASGGW